MNPNLEEQEDELFVLQSIFDPEEFIRDESKFSGQIRVSVELPANFKVVLKEGENLRRYEISFLPPLLLTFDLPEDYPSSSPPFFSLACPWLTQEQMTALRAHLLDLYSATGGAVVLFSWVQFLREDALRFLDINSLLELPADGFEDLHHQHNAAEENQPIPELEPADPDVPASPRSSSEPLDAGEAAAAASSVLRSPEAERSLRDVPLTPSQTVLSQILIFDAAQKEKVFASSIVDCGVCFVGCLGSQCVQLAECGHVFCKACLTEFCRLQITEGNVRGVSCPQASCSGSPTPAQVKSLVGEELFCRYDRLLLQSTLDSMSDVTYCPRTSCASAVIVEKSSRAALCSVCGFAFCVSCRKTFHGREPCMGKKKMESLMDRVDLPHSGDGRKALQEDYVQGSKARRRLLEARYGRNLLQYVADTSLSEDWIADNSKPCPHCSCKIEKNGGCNFMRCTKCRNSFCWHCLTSVVQYCGNFISRLRSWVSNLRPVGLNRPKRESNRVLEIISV